MSPTEDDLRAALRHGQGDDALDADRVIARGEARRVQRRTRLLGGTATAVFVAALATGGALLANNSGNDAGTAASAKNAPRLDKVAGPAAAASASPSGILPGNGSVAGTHSTAGPCPVSPTHELLPGGGSPGQFGAGGKLFPKPVQRLIICGYTSGPTVHTKQPGRATLTGSSATNLVNSLENAAKTKPTGACPDYQFAVQRTVTFIGIATDGTAERPVTATLSGPACRVVVTNGTAVRYGWTPPTSISAKLQSLTATTGARPGLNQPGGGNQKNGSPVRS